jgi:acyl carrier protein
MDLAAELASSISTVCGVPRDAVTPDARLVDLGVDSLAAGEVLVDVEIRLGIELPVDIVRRLATVETVRDVAAALSGAAPTPAAPTPAAPTPAAPTPAAPTQAAPSQRAPT